MIPDDSSPPRVKNWPEQHYNNGVNKNGKTSRKYKRVVRILKSLSNEMTSKNIKSAQDAPSFLVECLVWNTPDSAFSGQSFYSTIRNVLAYLFNNTMRDEQSKDWGEVSDLKYLFRSSQPWTRSGAHQFISDAWDYIGYK